VSRVGWARVLLKWRLEDLRLAAYMSRQRTSFRSAKAAATTTAGSTAAKNRATLSAMLSLSIAVSSSYS